MLYSFVTNSWFLISRYNTHRPRRYEFRMLMEYLQDVIQKTPVIGDFKINNLRWDIEMRMRISVTTWLSKYVLRDPKVCWEIIERVSVLIFHCYLVCSVTEYCYCPFWDCPGMHFWWKTEKSNSFGSWRQVDIRRRHLARTAFSMARRLWLWRWFGREEAV